MKTTYRAIIQPDYFTQDFTGEGETKELARKDCENQLRAVLEQLRNTSRVPVALVSFVCLDPDPVAPVNYRFEPRRAVRAPQAWEPSKGGIRDSGIFRNILSILSK